MIWGYPHFRKPQKPPAFTQVTAAAEEAPPFCFLFVEDPGSLAKSVGCSVDWFKGILHEPIDVSITVNIFYIKPILFPFPYQWIGLYRCFPVNVHLNQSIDILLQQTRWCMMVFWMGKFNDSTIILMGISGAFFIKLSHWGSWNGHWMMVWGLFFAFLWRNHIQLHAYVYI
jgi:hypothetical protein